MRDNARSKTSFIHKAKDAVIKSGKGPTVCCNSQLEDARCPEDAKSKTALQARTP